MRKLTASILLAIGLMGTASAETTPATTPTSAQTTPAAAAPATTNPSSSTPANNAPETQNPATAENTTTPTVSESVEITTDNQGGFDKDLSVWECTKTPIML